MFMVFLDRRTAAGRSSKSEVVKVIMAVSIATSVPLPIAIPTSARARACESFTPSPTIATTSPRCCNSCTKASLSDGSIRDFHKEISASEATRATAASLSPESIYTFSPIRFMRSIATGDDSFTWSASSSVASSWLPLPKYTLLPPLLSGNFPSTPFSRA